MCCFRNYIAVLMLFLCFSGCKKIAMEDSFLKPRRVYDLAVEGGINTLTRPQYIRLTKPALHPDSTPKPISKASVVVNDGKTNMVFRETTTAGVYTVTNLNDPNYNYAYTLTIKYDNKTYTAVDTLRQVVNIVDDFLPLSARQRSETKTVDGTIPKHTFGYVNPNKWFIAYQDIPLWNPAKFDQTKYYSYTHILGSPNSLYPLNNLKRTFTLGQDDYISIYKISLSENYAKYLYAVFMETDWSGLFSSVPVNVEGNISGNAQGYFSVSDVDMRRYKAREL
ncbi:hypothetical protein SAMN04488524_2396 [Pedobacter africanus]|uniref:DUF4249 domain-containing protein n=2 Tax=Pedobacter africanus TaxID=151894 RepID=A0A1W2BIN6_9SPHI|nr:hypothetical protein SAMN04488524_2396 [Pedobacter africanus]